MKDERIYLRHIVEAIEDIEKYTASGYAAFMCERMRQDAVIRKLEVIGERLNRPTVAAIRINETPGHLSSLFESGEQGRV